MTAPAQIEAPDENVVADYLAHRLSDSQAQTFELYCLEHPAFARQVEQELALKTGMGQMPEGSDRPHALPDHRGMGRWPLALAASVLILISAGLVFKYSARQQPQLVAFRSAADLTDQLKHAAVSEVRLARVRGQGTVTHVSVPTDGIVEIRVLPDFASETGYSIKIAADATGSTQSLIVRDLKPTGDGFLQIYVPAAPLIGRTWLLSVGEGAGTEAFRLEFSSAPAAAP